MAFTQQQNITITGHEDVELVLFIPGAGSTVPQYGDISIQLAMSDGSIRVVKYNLLERLQDDAAGLTHLSNLNSLKTYILTRIENEILPP